MRQEEYNSTCDLMYEVTFLSSWQSGPLSLILSQNLQLFHTWQRTLTGTEAGFSRTIRQLIGTGLFTDSGFIRFTGARVVMSVITCLKIPIKRPMEAMRD